MDLLQTLYDYAFERRMVQYLEDSRAYRESSAAAERELADLRRTLGDQGAKRLEDYIDGMALVEELKLEAMFRAGLSVGQELSRL